MLFRDSRDSRFVPRQFPDRFFFVFQYSDEKTEGWQGASGKGSRCSIFRTEKYFYYHRVSNDRSVLSQSLTIFCSVAGISHSRGRYFLIRGWWGCAAGWGRIVTSGLTIIGSHFLWSHWNGVAHFRIFGVKKSSSHLRLANVSECLYCRWKVKYSSFIIKYCRYINRK